MDVDDEAKDPDNMGADFDKPGDHGEQPQQQSHEQPDERRPPHLPQIRGVVKGADHVIILSQELATDASKELFLLRNKLLQDSSLEPSQGFSCLSQSRNASRQWWSLLLPCLMCKQKLGT
eukprot:8500839-Karenia_brevis.AAC.1